MRIFALGAVLLAACVIASPRPARAQEGTAAVGSQTRFECPGCLLPAAPDAERCAQCGVSFKKLEYVCPNPKCQKPIAWDAVRCASCGLAFDAPTPGEKEKRSAKEREMPATRDFLKNLPETSANPGMEVNGRSLTLWRTGRETSFNGTTTITRFVEDLSLNVLHIGVPQLSFHGQLEFLGDPNLRPQHSTQLNLREAYFRYQSDDVATQLQVGRQFINSGVTRSFVDAIFWHQMLGDRLGIETHLGHPVSTNKLDAGGDFEYGGRVFYRGIPGVASKTFRDMTVGLSFHEEIWDSRVVRRDLGFDFNFSPTWEIDISGHAYYSFVAETFYDARFTFMARPTGWLQLTFDYQYVEPSALLPASSMFLTFADDMRHEFEFDVDVFPVERLKLRAYFRMFLIPNTTTRTAVTFTKLDVGEEVPYELGTGFSLKHGQVVKGELGMELGLQVKGGIQRFEGATVRQASMFQFRIYEMVAYDIADKHTLKGSVDLHLEQYDGKVYKHQNSAGTLTLSAGYMYDHKYSFTFGGDYRSTPQFRNTYDVFAKLEVPF